MQGELRYEEFVVGDDWFALGRHQVRGDAEMNFAPADIFILHSAGSAPWAFGGRDGNFDAAPVLIPPSREIYVRHNAGSIALSVTLQREQLTMLTRAYYGPDFHLRLETPASINAARSEWWRNLIELTQSMPIDRPVIRAKVYRAVTLGALEMFDLVPNEDARVAAVSNRELHFRQACEFVDAHAGLPIGVDSAATAAGVSVRELRRLFFAFAPDGVTPERYLQQQRLQGAHGDLVRADPAQTTVREVAWQWGFARSGTFVRLYLQRYGAMPHEELGRPGRSR